MEALLLKLEKEANADILPITIDSYTRLKLFEKLSCIDFRNLNGFPLCNHGWKKTRLLNEKFNAPLQVRHGSPDPKILFDFSIASGITAFEGGGISYNIPYCKNVPLENSIRNWEYVDQMCGYLSTPGIIVDRELFGSLTGVLVPPSISICISLLEALLATKQGVKCISISFPQTGYIFQDVASFRALKALIKKYLPPDVDYYTVLHEYMGVFPNDICKANALIFLGGLTGVLCKANKIITKTIQEVIGIPDPEKNANGVLITRSGCSELFNFISLNEEEIEKEESWICREVNDLMVPILEKQQLQQGIITAFEKGFIDIPFGASRFNQGKVMPLRDNSGALRFFNMGNLPFSEDVVKWNKKCLGVKNTRQNGRSFEIYYRIIDSINFFT